MMDAQQAIALAIVAASATLLVIRYARGRRGPKFRQCADCPAASTHSPAKGDTDTAGRAGGGAAT
jgi:hypothetical protein